MNEMDEIIKKKMQQDKYVPNSTQNVIDYTIRNCINRSKRPKIKFKNRIITIILSIIMALLGSVTVYAVTSGKMNEIPFIKRLGLKFSDEYENYKDNDVFQEVKNAETSVDLISTVCDDGFTILEFDVKLSKDDKEELRLGESIITDEDLEDAKKLDEKYIGTINYSDKYNTLMRFKSVVNTIRLEFNKNIGELKRDYNIIIDNEKYYVKNQQKVLKVSDYEYIVYQMYFLTDEVLQNKNTFTLTLELNEIANRGDEENYKGSAKGVIVNTTHNKKSISIDGKFNVEVSKEKALENTKKIEPDNTIARYKNMSKNITEIKVTPLQIIVNLETKIENVSSSSLAGENDKDYIGRIDYNVSDDKGNELLKYSFESKRTITYSNGKVEEWSPGDIKTNKTFSGATMSLVEYIIIEKADDVKQINITPIVDGDKVELETFKINL